MIRTLIAGTLGLLSFLGVFTVAHAETQVSGTLAGDTTWIIAGSPYVVTDSVTLPGGSTLTIEPGVVVTLSDSGSITASGTIIAIGTQENPITITSTLGASGFGTIDIKNGGSATFTYSNILSIFSIGVDAATLHFTDSTLTQTRQGLLASHGALVVLERYILDSITGSGIQGSTGASIVARVGRITNVNMANGFGTHYGILLNAGATGEFNDLTLAHCYCPGITVNSGAVLSVASSTIFNTTGARGIFLDHASSTIRDLMLSTTGDGIVSNASTLTLGSSTLRALSRGALSLLGYSTTTASNITIVSTVQSAITLSESFLDLDRATLSQISGSSAVIVSSGARAVIASTTLKNSSSFYGILMQSDSPSLVLTDSTITGFTGPAIYADKSQVAVTGSTITGNGIGIDAHTASGGPAVSIHDSIIMSNTQGIVNTGSVQGTTTTYTDVDARNNWWGTLSGPQGPDTPFGAGNLVSVHVDVLPFLILPPGTIVTTPPCAVNCNSNVMFLPGLQASRLYKPDYDGHGGTDRLWEPNGNADIRDLYLDANGNSIRSDIYATEIIDEIFGLSPDIYKTFIEMMDDLKNDHVINDWSPIPYDWRLTVDDILENGTKIQNGYSYDIASATPYVFQELERLAATSTTGKVTIIAHSNGGLVAKALMVRLEQMGKAGLVDKVILLASPQLGTPKAVASLLHGEDQEYLGGLMMDKPTARELGKNMPGAYQLIPSAKYFDVVVDPTVIIRNTPSTESLFNAYSTSTDSIEDLYALLRGDEGRTGAMFEDVESLSNLNASLITQARNLHNLIDGWVAPTSTQVIEIAGWGLDTLRGIRYTDRSIAGCTVGVCRRLTYTPLFTDDGDETVVVPSAIATASSTRYWVDLFEANRKEDEKWSHKNISEVTQVKRLIKDILSTTTINLPSYISQTPSTASIAKKLRYTLHSPLSLGVYDTQGRYTGVSTSTILGVEYPIVIEEIPNSYYMEFGETKIIGFEEGSSTISMLGQALGVFTLEGEKIEGGVTVASTTFPDIPVATGTIVTLFQSAGALSPIIGVDFDGNGTTDVQIGEDGFSETDGVALLRGMVTTLGLGIKQEKRLLTIIDRLDNVVKKEFKKPERKVIRLNKVLDRITEVTQKMAQKGKITSDDKTELLKLIGVVRQQVI